MSCGESHIFPVISNTIYQKNEQGKNVYGLLIGTLDTNPKQITHKIISCVNNDIGHITKDMWYIYDHKTSASSGDKECSQS